MSGAYRRETNCRYCYQSGHNIAGCPKLKDYIKANPNSYWADRINRRKERLKHRKCTYCKQEGHNRKTCSFIMDAMVKVAALNADFRKKFIDNVASKDGLGPGALLSVNGVNGYKLDGSYCYDSKDQLALVTDINLNNIQYPNRCGWSECIHVEMLNLYNYNYENGAKLTTVLSIPNWYILGKESIGKRFPLNYKVVSRGYLNIDDEEKWTKDKDAIKRICTESYTNHSDIEYALKYHVL